MKKNIDIRNIIITCDICQAEIANLNGQKSSWYFRGGVNGIVEKLNVEYKIQTQRGVVDVENIHKAGYAAFPQYDVCSKECFKKAFKEWVTICEDLLAEPAKLTQKLTETIVNEIEKPPGKED